MEQQASLIIPSSGAVARRFSISSNVIPGVIAALDGAVILSAALISYSVVVIEHVQDPSYYAAAIAFVWLVTLMLMNFGGLYQFEPIMRPLAFSGKIVIAFATTFLFLLAAAFALKISAEFSRVWIASFAMGACAATLAVRLASSRALARLSEMRVFSRNLVIAGAPEQTTRLLKHLSKLQPRFISVLGVFADGSRDALQDASYPILGRLEELPSYVRNNNVDDVVIALPWSADERILAIVTTLRELPVNVYLGADLIGFRLPYRPPPDHFGGMPLVEVMGRPLAAWGSLQKQAIDYGLGTILALLFLPVMALIAIAVKVESRGPILFRQARYGFNNRVFDVYKFRTMVHAPVCSERTQQASRGDPRVTRVGRVLRRWSLDELPQLFNVLNGTMSLVGPRPHAVDHNEAYSQMIRGYFARHRVKPGLTGWAQVNGLRGETRTLDAMEMRVKHDIHYVENWSPLFDFRILLLTLVICLTGRNAY